MASKSKHRSAARKGNRPKRPEIGLFDIPDINSIEDVSDDSADENDLESELEALLSGKEQPRQQKTKKKVAPILDIEKMAAACLKDTDDEDDANMSADEDILKELNEIALDDPSDTDLPSPASHAIQGDQTIPKRDSDSVSKSPILNILEERLALYTEALEVAKSINEVTKIRRFKRALDTLKSQIKLAKTGGTVPEEDIPPPVSVKNIATPKHTSVTSNVHVEENFVENSSAPEVKPYHGVNETLMSDLIARRDQYKKVALQAKKCGDQQNAFAYMKGYKTLNAAIAAAQEGNAVDMDNLPPALDNLNTSANSSAQIIDSANSSPPSDFEKAALAAAEESDVSDVFSAPPAATTILEALQQRLQKYSETKAAAAEENNNSKVRRLDRIIKQYQTAIKDYKAGKPVAFEDLPVPPGFAPIPANIPSPEAPPQNKRPAPEVPPQNKRPAPEVPKQSQGQIPEKPKQNPNAPPKQKLQRTNTISDKTLTFLQERQLLFKQAALEAKKSGDIMLAKEYLRSSKGFDTMIDAVKCGLPIDMTSIPTPPQLESDFVIIQMSDCNMAENVPRDELLVTLESDLRNQLQICSSNKENFLRVGDVTSASRFEKLHAETKKDLAVINYLQKSETEIPKFHYETRIFSIVKCNADLSEDDIAVSIERAISLPGKSVSSYVRVEFPFPTDSPQSAKTSTVRDTQDPEYKSNMNFTFQRKSRATQRLFKRHAIKCDIYSKGGFFHNDSLIGTVNVKLSSLESKCTVHECYDLMNGRKAVGGKLEVQIRIREPILVKQVEEVQEKWLIFGS